MNLTMRALIAVVATVGLVGLAGAYLGAAALQDGSPDEPVVQSTKVPYAGEPLNSLGALDEPGAEPPPGDDTPSPSATTPAGTPVPVPSDWKEYTDPELGFTVSLPTGLVRSENVVQLSELGEIPATELRQIGYSRADGLPVVAVSTAPNPAGATLEEWIRAVPGWPCEPGAFPTCDPEEVFIGGERGIRFSISVIGGPTAIIYFAHGQSIYSLYGNVHGSGKYEPALTEQEFQLILDSFRVGDE